MTQAMKCRCLEEVCDPDDTGHEVKNFPTYYTRNMFNDDTQQVSCATQMGLSVRDSAHQRTSTIFPCHSATFKDNPTEGLQPPLQRILILQKRIQFPEHPSTEHCGPKGSKHHS